ncbi:MAG: hypothetical protein PPFGHCPK_01198 [Spiroplasma endosymbiont of Drosophila atripex]|nr:MAG: hypothetical protein PPFGHCPK_01198 [Spiroplasma endosymbiont of Drosophila atripex]
MRLLIITLTILFLASNGLVVLKLIKNFNENEIVSKEKMIQKLLLLLLKLKNIYQLEKIYVYEINIMLKFLIQK